MTLQWYGQACFRIETQGAVIAIDPFSKVPEWGIAKTPRFKANIVLISHEHQDHNNAEAIEGEPLVFRGPGEYEAGGIFIEGIHSYHDNQEGKERGANTIFVISSEGMRLCHMGDFGESKLSAEQLEKIGEIEVLLIPVGGKYTIGPAGAANVVKQIEPHAVIPMHYKVPGLKLPLESVEQFWKEAGVRPSIEEKVSFRSRDFSGDGVKYFQLKPLAFS